MPVDVPEIIESDDTRVACDGGGVLGHPKVTWKWAIKPTWNAPIATAASRFAKERRRIECCAKGRRKGILADRDVAERSYRTSETCCSVYTCSLGSAVCFPRHWWPECWT